MRVIVRGMWAPYVGTDYCEALGIFDSLDEAEPHASDLAHDRWEPDEEDNGIEDEGPEYWVEEYDPEKHDGYRAGGGSFEDDFRRWEIGANRGPALD